MFKFEIKENNNRKRRELIISLFLIQKVKKYEER